MRPLTPDDLLPLDEYVVRRPELFASQRRYRDRYRRVRVGPALTLLFENRQTLWFRLQETLRVARLTDPDEVKAELDWYNQMLPRRGRLQAALLIDVPDESQLPEVLKFWQELTGEAVHLQMGDDSAPGHLLTARPEDRCAGAAHWIEFAVEGRLRLALADFRRPARFEADYKTYRHDSPPLSDEVRQSLLDDLDLSDRDG
jgi:Protein of unknown function (DUF3501)